MAISRFAPSPTGRLHLGHAYSAMLAHDAARAANGRFLLRIEDIDTARCRPDYVEGILDDLRWLGLSWDGNPVIQTQRAEFHQAALDRLRALGLLYRCVCTRAEIAASASAPHGAAEAIYPGTCRMRAIASDDPRPFAERIDMARATAQTGPLDWIDIEAGRIIADPLGAGDVVLARKGLGVSYHLAVTVDDAAAGVTRVVRGRDLFGATHVQRIVQVLLGYPAPIYQHHALVTDPAGKRLAKRTPGATIADLRRECIDPSALLANLRAGRLPVGFRWAQA